MKRLTLAVAALAAASTAAGAGAQPMDHSQHGGQAMPPEASSPKAGEGGMDHGALDHASMNHAMPGMDEGDAPAPFTGGSGTSRLPGGEGHGGGLHVMAGDWMLMAHGFLSLQYTDHDGPRGDDMLYSTSMLMASASRDLGGARLALRSMMSIEPTLPPRGYPNLFATGETADGAALVDRQHPHDLFMELSARLDVDVAPGTSLFLYGGPVGEPALGPSAFMMRGSARDNPEPPITHHWFDSTHITYGVATAGLSSGLWQIEASAFRGAEPDEDRWDIETPRLDSWSVRASLTPSPNWAAQLSHGFIKTPEATHPGQNERRTTASVHYQGGGLAAMAALSSKARTGGGHEKALWAWLAEANWDLSPRHSLFGRVEHVTNDEFFPDHDDPLHERRFAVTKLQAGYAYHLPLGKLFSLGLGGSANAYLKPAALDAAYGRSPMGYTLFARLRLGR